jgi:serine-type D-Ala-D-Ala carboxypeptidase/endopeptidase (penicillin-binding protein 4)
MTKIFLAFGFFLFSFNAYVQEKKLIDQDHNLNKALTEFKADKELKNASIGFLAIDTKTGETIAELNPDLSLMPASTQKLITTSAAFEVLGKNFRYKTYLQYSGKIDTVKKVLKGDIYIKGGADPTLGSEYFDKNRSYFFIKNWISTIKNSQIDSIDGRIIADASVYGTEITPPKWSWEDVGNYYGAGANGLTAFDDLYRIYFISPSKAGALTTISKVDPEIPGLSLYNEVLSSDSDSDEAFVFGAPYSYMQIIRGTIPKGKSEFVIKAAMPDPAYYLAWYFEQELKKSGIKMKGEATTNRILEIHGESMDTIRCALDQYNSPSLTSIIGITNKKSINLFAEHLFNEIAHKLKNDGSNSTAIKVVTDFWKSKGMDTEGFNIYDGCGLSRYNAITPRQLVFVLNYMLNKSKNFDVFYESLPVAGESGTLSFVGKNTSAKGVVHAKSGSIGRVRAYTGYVTTKSGRMLAFSMNIANYNCSSSEAVEKLTKLMVAMADFNL